MDKTAKASIIAISLMVLVVIIKISDLKKSDATISDYQHLYR